MDNKHHLVSNTISIQPQSQQQQQQHLLLPQTQKLNRLTQFQQPQPKLIELNREIVIKQNVNENQTLPLQPPQIQPVTRPSQQENPQQQEQQSTAPKVTVSLPKHVASRLLELVQKRDMELLKLGIISVQFENDQIIPLTLNQNSQLSDTNSSQYHQPNEITPVPIATSSENLLESNIKNCNEVVDCYPNVLTNPTITTITELPSSPIGPILDGEDEEEQEGESIDNFSNTNNHVSTTNNLSSISNTSTSITVTSSEAIKPTTNSSLITTTTTTTTTQSTVTNSNSVANPTTIAKLNNCNITTNKATPTTDSLTVVYVEEEEDNDEKDDFETVVSDVEPQHSNYNIHQLTQLEFADPMEVEMYENDNDLLFPDYTLNLS